MKMQRLTSNSFNPKTRSDSYQSIVQTHKNEVFIETYRHYTFTHIYMYFFARCNIWSNDSARREITFQRKSKVLLLIKKTS